MPCILKVLVNEGLFRTLHNMKLCNESPAKRKERLQKRADEPQQVEPKKKKSAMRSIKEKCASFLFSSLCILQRFLGRLRDSVLCCVDESNVDVGC